MDRFLQHTKLMPSRKDAKALIDDRFVLINHKFAKPSSEVKNDDIIVINFPEEQLTIKARIDKQERVIYVGYDVVNIQKKEVFLC